MYRSFIELLCDGDYKNREILRGWFTIEDMLAIEKKKAAQQ